jgi:hypothetical protein
MKDAESEKHSVKKLIFFFFFSIKQIEKMNTKTTGKTLRQNQQMFSLFFGFQQQSKRKWGRCGNE